MKITLGKRTVNINVRTVSFFGKISGLMFKSSKTENLLFKFKSRGVKFIHSYFVFFPFLAIWLTEKNKVLNYEIIRPFTSLASSKHSAIGLIEIPFNHKNKEILELFVGKRKDLNMS